MRARLCRDCHRTVTLEPGSALAEQLQRAAIERAAWAFTIPVVLLVDGTPIDAARYIEHTLEARGDMDALRHVAGL
jgi:hypothetical protein